jgi:diguanylate cyclase (GGDEF)-like protein
VATALQSAIQRATDLAARYGGEEFGVVLPATDESGAELVAERMRSAVLELRLPRADDDNLCVSVSIGVATLRPVRGSMPDALVTAADGALYAAKEAGRNCVRVSGPRPVTSIDVAASSAN